MGYKFNPFTGNLDTVDSPNGVFEAVEVNGDITLDDGGTYTTTLQTITPTVSNKTISLPNATGTVALVAGSSGQLVYNNAGAQAGAPGSVVGATGDITLTLNGAASTPPLDITGTWFTGGGTTATKPQFLIEPTGTTSNAWSNDGTGLGVNAASTFTGRLLDLQTNGTSRAVVTGAGLVGIGNTSPGQRLSVTSVDNLTATNIARFASANDSVALGIGYETIRQTSASAGIIFAIQSNESMRIKSTGVVNLSNAPIYADNTTATAGGLAVGDVYKTAVGVLMIRY